MNNKSCGHDFERIKFWPFEGKKSEIQIYPRYDNRDGSYLLYTSVIGIQRKWNHEVYYSTYRSRRPSYKCKWRNIQK